MSIIFRKIHEKPDLSGEMRINSGRDCFDSNKLGRKLRVPFQSSKLSGRTPEEHIWQLRSRRNRAGVLHCSISYL